MGLLTLVFLLVIIQAIRTRMKFGAGDISIEDARRNMGYVRSMGILALVIGVFAQLMGLYDAFSAIQEMGEVSPAMLAGGLKVSMITTLYGIFILMVSIVLYVLLDAGLKKREVN